MAKQSTRLPLSVIIPVKNEERNIAACLESVAWADEVWVVDSHSADRTVEIARAYTDKIAQFDYAGGFPKKKNWALGNLPLAHEWVLIVDSDERVTPELGAEICALLSRGPEADGYYLNRKLIFLGRWIKHCGWYPSWNLRLFRHRLGRYERLETEDVENAGDVEVHEHIVLKGKAAYLKHDLLHEDFKSVYHFIERHNRYSNWDACVYHNLAGGVRTSSSIGTSLFGSPLERKRFLKRLWVRLPFRPLLRFLWMYVLRLGFLDGRPGLIFCTLMSMHEAVISAKLYEYQKQSGVRSPESGVKTGFPDARLQTSNPGLKTPDSGLRTPDSGL
jgi:glycosyltransferase involved in cell wall biosynthesis